MRHEHSSASFFSLFRLRQQLTLPREPLPTSHPTRTFTKKLLSTSFAQAQTNIASRTSTNITCHTNVPGGKSSPPLLLRHKERLPFELQPTSHVTRTLLSKVLCSSLAHAQTNTASETSTNITCHTNIHQETPPHFFCSCTNKPCLSNLKQHHMSHEHP